MTEEQIQRKWGFRVKITETTGPGFKQAGGAMRAAGNKTTFPRPSWQVEFNPGERIKRFYDQVRVKESRFYREENCYSKFIAMVVDRKHKTQLSSRN